MGVVASVLWVRHLPPEERMETISRLRDICSACGSQLGSTEHNCEERVGANDPASPTPP